MRTISDIIRGTPLPDHKYSSLPPPHEGRSTYQLLKAVAKDGYYPCVDDVKIPASEVLHYGVQQIEKG